VPDSEFDDPAAWAFVGTGATITGGQLRFANPVIVSSQTIPLIVPTVGETYSYSIDVDRVPSSAIKERVLFGGVEIFNQDGAGVKTGTVTPINASGLIFQAQHVGQWYLNRISIMADSIRESILQSLKAQLAAILTANGYELNVLTVARVQRVFIDTELPAIGIFDNDELSVNSFNFTRNKVEIVVEFHADAGVENRSVYANRMLADLKRAVLSADVTHGGLAESTIITAATVQIPSDDDQTTLAVLVTFTVDYEEITGDPYTTP
jgi:hypothetical protein